MKKIESAVLLYREEYCVRQLIDIDPSDMVVGLSLASGKLFAENDNGVDRLLKVNLFYVNFGELRLGQSLNY